MTPLSSKPPSNFCVPGTWLFWPACVRKYFERLLTSPCALPVMFTMWPQPIGSTSAASRLSNASPEPMLYRWMSRPGNCRPLWSTATMPSRRLVCFKKSILNLNRHPGGHGTHQFISHGSGGMGHVIHDQAACARPLTPQSHVAADTSLWKAGDVNGQHIH